MVAPIGSNSALSYSSTVKPSTGLEFELAKYQKELSDCVNCDSANTAEGRSNIQELHNKISAIKARIEKQALTEANHASGLNRDVPNALNVAAENKSVGSSTSAPGPTTGTIGRLIDVRA